MENRIYHNIISAAGRKKKLLAVLIDPDSYQPVKLKELVGKAETGIDFFFLGGSLTSNAIEPLTKLIKRLTKIPIILFPGNLLQLDKNADALLLLSLVSGRNPELLIGNHVIAAPFIRQSGLESISTAYMLIESGITTSVEYISNTKAIPRNKTNIAIATAIASELLGFSLIYLEAGSGAKYPVPPEMIRAIKNETNLPLIVGGGIRSNENCVKAYRAGADMIVVGNSLETKPELLDEFLKIKKELNKNV